MPLAVLPVPREEFVELALRRPGDAVEDVGEPGLRIDIVELGGADERVHRRRPHAAAVGTGEQPRLPAQSDTAQCPFGGVVRKAISASAPDTFASAFAARASAAARAVFRAEMLDPPVIGGIESNRPIRRYNIPPDRVVPPPISPRETVARSEPGSANRSPRAGSPAAPR